MLDYQVQRCSRRCASSQRELEPGETFYSVLVPDGDEIVRRDYAVDAWQGPPDKALGWWKSRIPTARDNKVHWAPNDVMLHYFVELAERPEKADIRYILALLMLRRRILRLEETETDADGRQVLVVYCARHESEHRVTVVQPAAEQVELIQEELAQLLFADAN